MIKIEGTPGELKRLKAMLNFDALCPFGTRNLTKRCMEYRDCRKCIDTNIEWVVLRNSNAYCKE